MALLNRLIYHPDGTLWWSNEAYHNCRNKLAGSKSGSGYWYIHSGSRSYKRGRLVWELHHGVIPSGMVIDHLNGVRDDDRIENLQLISQADNVMLGTASLKANNTHGYTGVYFIPSRRPGKQYQASVRYKGKNISFGYHATPEEAHKARAVGMEKLGLESRRNQQLI